MVVLECVIYITMLVVGPKNDLIMGQTNHHMYLLKNGATLTWLANYHHIHYANIIQILHL